MRRGWTITGAIRDMFTRRLTEEDDAALERHLAQVPEGDHCLAAVREALARKIVYYANTVSDPLAEDRIKLRAIERLQAVRDFLEEFNAQWEQARAQSEPQPPPS